MIECVQLLQEGLIIKVGLWLLNFPDSLFIKEKKVLVKEGFVLKDLLTLHEMLY